MLERPTNMGSARWAEPLFPIPVESNCDAQRGKTIAHSQTIGSVQYV